MDQQTLQNKLETSISSVRTGKIIELKNLIHEIGLLCNDRSMDKRTLGKILEIHDRRLHELLTRRT